MKKIKATAFVIKSFESILVIGYILFEELIWNIFAKPIYQYFKNLIALDSLKKIFIGMNRHLLLSIFIFIFAITEILGFLAGFCFINGYILTGVIVYTSKIPIAAFTFWLFDLTKEKLMTFNWLKNSYQYLMGIIDKFTHTSIYINIKVRTHSIKSKIKSLAHKYLEGEGLVVSIKHHYLMIKPHFLSLINKDKNM